MTTSALKCASSKLKLTPMPSIRRKLPAGSRVAAIDQVRPDAVAVAFRSSVTSVAETTATITYWAPPIVIVLPMSLGMK